MKPFGFHSIVNDTTSIGLVVEDVFDSENITAIKIFTRPIYPITNFSVIAYSTYNKLSWNPSIDNDIQKLVIYRAELPLGSELPLINDNE